LYAPIATGFIDYDWDGDGPIRRDELRAGTDPLDPDSVFGVMDMGPVGTEGFVIRWHSATDMTYTVWRGTNMLVGVTNLMTTVGATAPVNTYTDTTAVGLGPYFYRVSATN